jgi:hypothetical protein
MENQQIEIKLPPITSAEINKVVSDDKALERFLAAQISLNQEGVYFEHSCPICNSYIRKDAEEKWLVSRNADEIRDFLKEKGEPASITVIKNHMEFHIDQSYVELRKREYINKILTLSQCSIDTMSRVETALCSINERIFSIGAVEDPDCSPVAIQKMKAEETCKLVTAMTKLLELRANLMGEMKNSGDLLSIRQEDFAKIFSEILEEFKTDEARKIVNKILEKFVAMAKKK